MSRCAGVILFCFLYRRINSVDGNDLDNLESVEAREFLFEADELRRICQNLS